MKTQVVTVLIATLLVESLQQPSIYPGCWTDWMDRDNPSGTGDWETLADLRNTYKICETPLAIEVQTLAGGSVESTGDVIYKSDTTTGFVCLNKEQTKTLGCSDYRVRFLCPVEFCHPNGCWTQWFDKDDPKDPRGGLLKDRCWTRFFDRDDPSVTGDWETLQSLRDAYEGEICEDPLYLEAQTTSGGSVESTNDVISIASPSDGFVCKNNDQTDGECEDYEVRFYCPEKFCKAQGCWTEWFDRDNPSGTGDWETLEDLIHENPGEICESPLQMEVRTTDGGEIPADEAILLNNPSTGFVCVNANQPDGICEDYEVRFFCPREFCEAKGCWTEWFDRDNPSGTGDWETLEDLIHENPGKICESPKKIEVQTTTGQSVTSTQENIAFMDTVTGFACKRSDQDDGECEDYKVRFLCPEEFCQPQDDSDLGDGAPSGHMCKYIRVCLPIESECNWAGVSIEGFLG